MPRQLTRFTQVAGDDGFRQLSVLPEDVCGEAAAGAQAVNMAVRPSRGKGGEEAKDAGVTLEEEFGDAGGAAQVAVNLEDLRWVEIE